MSDQTKEQVKEGFCTSCVGAGLAIAGAGTASAGSLTKKEHQIWKQVLLWSGVGICIIAVVLLIAGFFMK